jgi:hypothetical protein
MKKNYLFFLIISVYIQSYAQSNCEDAHSDVIYAYSHVKSAYNSNNITHLKYYSKRSLDAFNRAKKKLNACKCEASYNNAYDASELLDNVSNSKTFEDGRFYVKRARDIAKKVINELDLCTQLSIEDEVLAELENKQFKLKQQQIELNLKEEQIKLKLAEKEAKELYLKKEQLIQKNELAIIANVRTFNDILLACECDTEIVEIERDKGVFLSKNLEEIKANYLTIIKSMTTNYLQKLSACDN